MQNVQIILIIGINAINFKGVDNYLVLTIVRFQNRLFFLTDKQDLKMSPALQEMTYLSGNIFLNYVVSLLENYFRCIPF